MKASSVSHPLDSRLTPLKSTLVLCILEDLSLKTYYVNVHPVQETGHQLLVVTKRVELKVSCPRSR